MNLTTTLTEPKTARAKSRRLAQKRRVRWHVARETFAEPSARRRIASVEAGVAESFEESSTPSLPSLTTALHGAPRAKNERVLVVDSVPLMRGSISNVLRRLGYRVVEACGAIEVQRLTVTEKDIRLLILDLSSLEISDLEFVAWFRMSHPAIKVVVAASSLWELSFYHGVTQEITLLAKPFTPMELARIVRRTLD